MNMRLSGFHCSLVTIIIILGRLMITINFSPFNNCHLIHLETWQQHVCNLSHDMMEGAPREGWGGVLTWWRDWMEPFSALLAFCAGNSPVTGEFPAQRPETRSFDVFFDLRLNKRLSKQSWGWWFETLSRPLWRHCNEIHFNLGFPQFIHWCNGRDGKYRWNSNETSGIW